MVNKYFCQFTDNLDFKKFTFKYIVDFLSIKLFKFVCWRILFQSLQVSDTLSRQDKLLEEIRTEHHKFVGDTGNSISRPII